MCKYIEVTLKKEDNEIERKELSIEQIEKFCSYMKPNIQPESIYCIERINSDKFVEVIIKYGNKTGEKNKNFILDRYRSGKIPMLENLRRAV